MLKIEYAEVAYALKLINKKMSDLYSYCGFTRQSASNFKRSGYIPMKHAECIGEFFEYPAYDVANNRIVKNLKMKEMRRKNPSAVAREDLPVDDDDTGNTLYIDNRFFNKRPDAKVYTFKIEDDSMFPILKSGSRVLYVKEKGFQGDGLYTVQAGSKKTVRMVQYNFGEKQYDIMTYNKEYNTHSTKDDSIITGKIILSMI